MTRREWADVLLELLHAAALVALLAGVAGVLARCAP